MSGTMTTGEGTAAGPGAEEAVRWAALGDSFTAGIRPGELTWSRLVVELVSPTRPVELANYARAGATVAELEREQLEAAIATRPDIVTLICGGNDVIGTVRPSLEGFGAGLDRVWASLRGALPDAAILTATYPAIAPGALRPRTRRRIESGLVELNATIRAVASRNEGLCIELADHPGEGDRSNYAADGIHPSAAGHRAAAAVLGPAIEQLIERRSSEKEEVR